MSNLYLGVNYKYMRNRYLQEFIKADLEKKMVLLAGPRQVGKTFLSKQICPPAQTCYLNYDVSKHRTRLLKQEFGPEKFWIFDEIHKFKRWKNYLKGVFDEHRDQHSILVTGSARLDLFRKAGDSLQGRYFFYRLNPLSVNELGISNRKEMRELFDLSGFPEPFFSSSKKEANRWTQDYTARVLQEDVRNVERVFDLALLEQLIHRLPDCVGAPLSINALREDLQLNHKTVTRWVDLLERFYLIFRVLPFGSPKIKAVKKEQKHYHFDWNVIKPPGARFENFIAVHLLKHVHFLRDTEGRALELRYLRFIDGREVDFVIVEESRPILAVECKFGDSEVQPALRSLKNKFPELDCWQIHFDGSKDYVSSEGIRVAPALTLLKTLAV